MPDAVFKSFESKEMTLSDGTGAGFVKSDANGVLSGGNSSSLGAVAEDIIPAIDGTYSLGSISKRWAFIYATIGILGAAIIGSVIGFNNIDGVLFINASTTINGTLNVTQDIFTGGRPERVATLGDLTSGNITITEVIRVQNKQGVLAGALTLMHFSGYNVGQNAPETEFASSLDHNKQAECLTSETIANNGFGSCVVNGLIQGVDTSQFTEDVILHLNKTDGTLTEEQPSKVACVQEIGEVLRSHASQGVIFVDIPPGCEEVPSVVNVTGNLSVGNTFTIDEENEQFVFRGNITINSTDDSGGFKILFNGSHGCLGSC